MAGWRRDGRGGGGVSRRGSSYRHSLGDRRRDGHCQDQTEGSELLFPAIRYGPLITNENPKLFSPVFRRSSVRLVGGALVLRQVVETLEMVKYCRAEHLSLFFTMVISGRSAISGTVGVSGTVN